MAAVASPAPKADYVAYSGAVRWVIMIAVMLGTILEVLDTSIVNVAIPNMMGNLGATIDQISWVSTGYIIANVILLPLTGWLSNRFGRRNYLAASIVLFTIASFLCGTAHSLNQLVLYRVLQGAGGAALLSTAQATLLEVFPPGQVPMVQAIFTMGVVAAPTLGPTLGGFITDNFGWPWIFYINVPIGILAAILVLMFLKDSRYQTRSTKVDFVGIGLLAIGLGCLQTILETGNHEGWFESAMIVRLSIFAVLGLGTFIWWELKIDEPAVKLRLLKDRSFLAGAVMSIVLGFGLYGGIFVLPIFLQSVRHYSAMQSGMILMPGGLVTAACLPFIAFMIKRAQPRYMVAAGAILLISSMFVMRTITNDTGPEHMLLPLILRGFAMALMFLPLTLATLAGLPGRDIPYATGLFNLMRQLGGSVGIAALSTVLSHRISIHRARLVEDISVYNPATMERLNNLQHFFMSKGADVATAKQQAIAAINGIVQREAMIQSFEDCFLVIGLAFLFTLPLVMLFRKTQGMPKAPAGAH